MNPEVELTRYQVGSAGAAAPATPPKPERTLECATMTTDEALQFLRLHQPLPPTRDIGEQLLMRFDEARKHFAAHPDNRSVPLLLNSFGEGDGHGIYQLVECAILAHPENVVVAALLDGLRSPHSSVREWCAEIAINYARPELVAPLIGILRNGSVDERMAAAAALGINPTPEARRGLENAMQTDIDEEIRKAIRDAMG